MLWEFYVSARMSSDQPLAWDLGMPKEWWGGFCGRGIGEWWFSIKLALSWR